MRLDLACHRQPSIAMRSAWLDIPLADYEGHMAYPSVGQAQLLADRFERLVLRYLPKSVALIGCAGGNGLQRLAAGQLERIVAVDINPHYVEQSGIRHSHRLRNLELLCADVQSASLSFAPVELLYAALLFEYVDVSLTIMALRLVAPEELERCATGCGFAPMDSETVFAASGKQFCFQTFRSR